MSKNLAINLLEHGDEFIFIDNNEKNIKKNEGIFGFVNQHGNSYSKETLIDAGVERANFFIAANRNDKINFVSSQIAKNINSNIFNIVVINDQSNIDVFKGDDFDYIIKSNQITADTIASIVENNSVLHLFTNTDSHTEIIMINILENSNYIGKNINELSLPNNSKIIAVLNSSGNINHDYSTDLRVLDKILIQIPLKNEKTELNFLNEKRN
tara:strand:+ start:286 stop:921 length:636 start_codon:yes stop_codon:yes gene_type:complete